MNEGSAVQIERDAPDFNILLRSLTGKSRHLPSVPIHTANIPELGMGDNPTLVVKHKSVIAGIVAGKNHLFFLNGLDVLGKLH